MHKGPSINDVQFFDLFFEKPTSPVRFCPNVNLQFYHMVSNLVKVHLLKKVFLIFFRFQQRKSAEPVQPKIAVVETEDVGLNFALKNCK